ncbi:polysaccharide biosynthesis tyrosine autokinase [Nocardioides baekrokdamisoli]|nr:polysaccharide biosynthesis tyrosine autokinase [Nocardioides baekrokdamisoli]
MRLRRALARAWYLILVGALCGAAGGYVVYTRATPTYQASAQYVVGYSATRVGLDETTQRVLSAQRATTLIQIATTVPVIQDALKAAGLPNDAPTVTASGEDSNSFLTITVTDTDPQGAAQIANAYGSILLPQMVRLVGPIDKDVRLQVVAPAVPPRSQASPVLAHDLGYGLIAGLVLGLLIALAREMLDMSVRESDDVVAASGLTLLAAVPYSQPKVRLPTDRDPRSIRAEAYRQIRTAITSSQPTPQVIAVTSATSGEGKTTVTCNVATAFARAGHRVAVVDADLRRSSVSEVMDVPPGHPGLSEILLGRETLSETILMTNEELPDVLLAGEPVQDPSEHLASATFAGLVAELRTTYDFVFIDTPPVIPVTDALVVSPLCDAVVIVARIGYTTPARIRRAMTALTQVRAVTLGVVANCARGNADRDYRYGYASYYERGPRKPEGDSTTAPPTTPGKRANRGSHAR